MRKFTALYLILSLCIILGAALIACQNSGKPDTGAETNSGAKVQGKAGGADLVIGQWCADYIWFRADGRVHKRI